MDRSFKEAFREVSGKDAMLAPNFSQTPRVCFYESKIKDSQKFLFAVLFLDEPTTGLDASTSFTLTSLLDDLARENCMTVIMSIHQPRASIFKQIERMSLLSRGEKTAKVH